VSRDLQAAERYHKEMAKQKMVLPRGLHSFGLAILAAWGIDIDEMDVLEYWRLALEQGYLGVHYNLGVAMVENRSVETNYMQGCLHLRMAANGGHVLAKEVLARECS
jgi:hypothetical protein